jgi:hypothetical protein
MSGGHPHLINGISRLLAEEVKLPAEDEKEMPASAAITVWAAGPSLTWPCQSQRRQRGDAGNPAMPVADAACHEGNAATA